MTNKLTSAIRAAMGQREQLVAGLAWYRREQWARLREIAPDRDDLEDSFEEWVRNAESALVELGAQGTTVERVDVDVEALLAWCNEHGVEPTSDNRARYATYLLRRQHSDESDR